MPATELSTTMNNPQRIYVAGHRGLVGSALCRELHKNSNNHIITRTHAELNLTDPKAVEAFFDQEKPDQVYLAAAKVGGIQANNTYPADFIRDNLAIQLNVIESAYRSGTNRLLFLGSSCIYPREAPQPMQEAALLTGTLEPTNEPYAIAKIAGIKLCESYNRQYGTHFRSVMPTNLYGPGDNFDLENSHVIPALMRKFHQAKRDKLPGVTVWGSGSPKREFLHVDDMAEACVHIMNLDQTIYEQYTQPMLSHINIGTGKDISILELTKLMAETTGFKGKIIFDTSKPDGSPRKLLGVSRIKQMGWAARIELEDGLQKTYEWFLNNTHIIRTQETSSQSE